MPDAAPDRTVGQQLPPPPAGAEILTQNLRELTAALRDLGPAVRADGPDAVHQARTTTRRLRSLLALGAPLLATDAGPVEAELAHLGTALGTARDAEVRVELVAARLGRRKAAGLWKEARKHHAQAHKRLRTELDRGLLTAALAHLDALDPAPSDLGSRPAPEVLPPLVIDAIVVVRETAVGVASADGREEHEERLHEVRKASRTVRYSAEAARGRGAVDDRRGKKLVRAAGRLQDVLGQWRDLLLLEDWVSSQRGGRLRAPRGRMRALRADAAALEARWPGALSQLVVPEWSLAPE